MLVTITLLTVILLASYLTLQPGVENLPPTVPFRRENWMAFVPSSVQFVAYVNYRACIDTSGNSSLFGADPLLEIYSPSYLLYPKSIEYELTMNLLAQGSQEALPTVSVVKIDSQELNTLQKALESSQSVRKTEHGGYTIFDLLIRHKEHTVQLVSAALGIVHEHLVFAEGSGTLRYMIQILDAVNYEPSQLFYQEATRTALYASGGTSDDYLAFFAAAFPTQIKEASLVMKTVRRTSGSVASQIALSFDSQDKARKQYQAVKNLYAGGSDYWILDRFVVVKFSYEMSELSQQIRGL